MNKNLTKNIGAIILAGGKSKRFGVDKALFPIGETPLIQYVIDVVEKVTNNIIIITNFPEKMKFIPYPKYEDLIPNSGSLGGIYTGLFYSENLLNIILPCDMPFLSADCVNFLIENANGNDITVPYHRNLLEPLCAIYSKKCLPFIKDQIETGDYQIFQFYDEVRTKRVPFNSRLPFYHDRLFFNINTKQDLLELAKDITESHSKNKEKG